jgi:hypothetical protein
VPAKVVHIGLPHDRGMTIAGYLLAVAMLAAMVASLGVVGWRVRRWLLPEWSGSPARLAEVIIALTGLLGVSELLGAIGGFRRWPLLLTIALLAGASQLVRTPASPSGPLTAPPSASSEPLAIGAAAGAIVLVAGAWLVKTFYALRGGMMHWDTLWYHMPFAARFFQDGWVTRLHYVNNLPHTYLPANAELVHAVGILTFGNDVLSPVLNLGWLALALLAAWCIGRPDGVGAATLTGAALVLAVPVMVESQGGSAQSDVVGLALLLSALALAVQPDRSNSVLALAGASAGLALGTKLTFVAAILALSVVLIVASRGRRRRVAVVWGLAAAVTGSFWYVRNLAQAGSPMPWFSLGLGPVALPSLDTETFDCGTTSVADYARSPAAFARDLVPDISVALGPRWLLMLGLTAAGIVIAIIARRSQAATMLGVVALLAAVAYVVTPATAGGPNGGCFYYNTRFAVPALALGVMALALVLAGTRVPPGWVAALLAVVMAANVAAWNVGNPAPRLLLAGAVAFVSAGALRRLRLAPSMPRIRISLVLLAGALVVVAVGWTVQDQYLRDRYADGGMPELSDAAYLAVRDVTGARIAVAGFYTHYPLYGIDLSNRVDYPAMLTSWGRFQPIMRCSDWRHALRVGGYNLVVTAAGGYGGPEPKEARWTRGDPAATELVHQDKSSVFRIDPNRMARPESDGCDE